MGAQFPSTITNINYGPDLFDWITVTRLPYCDIGSYLVYYVSDVTNCKPDCLLGLSAFPEDRVARLLKIKPLGRK